MTYGNQVAAIAAAGWVHNKQGKGGIEICSVNQLEKQRMMY